MEPHWYGPHSLLVCRDCSFPARFRLDLPPDNLLCPNCGAENPVTALRSEPPPRVEVERLSGEIRRWEVVAFEAPTINAEPARLTVKRIVGLPGEEVRIAAGDLWIDGQRAVKSWTDQKSLAILLRDFDFLPLRGKGSSRSGNAEESPWHCEAEGSSWRLLDGGMELDTDGPTETATRLDYRHWAGYQSGLPRFAPVPILDAQPFDPREARSLEPVHDLLLLGEVATPEASFRVGFSQFEPSLSCEFSPASNQLTILSGETSVVYQVNYLPPDTAYQFGVSTFDRTLTIAVNDHPLVQIPIESLPSNDRARLAQPLFLQSSNGPVIFRHLRLLRDVYYRGRPTSDQQAEGERTFRLGSEQYLLLGDNPAESIDSRDWSEPGLPRSRLFGRLRHSGVR